MKAYRSYGDNGYGIVKGVLPHDHINLLLAEADRLHTLGSAFSQSTEDGPVKWLVVCQPSSTPILRGLQNGYRISPVLEALRTAASLYNILEPLIGPDIDSVANTLFWKPPGAEATAIAYHQDSMFRKPVARFRNLANSYIQVGLALDPHGPSNGGMRVVAESHRAGDLQIERKTSVMLDSPASMDLAAHGLADLEERDIQLDPGDVVFWHPHLLHGSPANRSDKLNRRFFVTGYMRSTDCDAGDPAFRNGQACAFA